MFLVAQTSARRASEIHAIGSDTLQWTPQGVTAYVDVKFLPKVAYLWHCNRAIYLGAMRKDADPVLRKLCVWTCLNAYLKATQKKSRTVPAFPVLRETKAGSTRVEIADLELATNCYQHSYV